MNMEEAIEKFIRRCKVKRCRSATISFYNYELSAWMKWWENKYSPQENVNTITEEDVEDYILYLNEIDEYKPRTIRNKLVALRTFLIFAAEKGYCNKIKVPIAKEQDSEIIPLTDEQLKDLYDACLIKKSLARIRDYTIMRVLEDTGIRLSEAIRLEVDDINLTDGYFPIMGETKNKKSREAYITPALKKELVYYLKVRQHFLTQNNITSKWLWIVTHGPEVGEPLNKRTLQDKIKKYGKLAGIPIRVSPHTFRHTFARNFLINGGDIETLRQLLGHSTLEMVFRYLHLFNKDRQNIFQSVMAKRYKKRAM